MQADVKRHQFNPWVGKIPWRRKWQPTPAFLPGDSHGQRSLCAFQSRVTKSWPWSDFSMHVQVIISSQGLILNLSTPVGVSFPVSDSICVFLFSTWVCAQDTWADPLLYLLPTGRTTQEGCIQAMCPAAAARRNQLVIGNWKWKLTLSHFFSMWEKPYFFCQVLDCVAFSLEMPIPVFSQEKCSYVNSQW